MTTTDRGNRFEGWWNFVLLSIEQPFSEIVTMSGNSKSDNNGMMSQFPMISQYQKRFLKQIFYGINHKKHHVTISVVSIPEKYCTEIELHEDWVIPFNMMERIASTHNRCLNCAAKIWFCKEVRLERVLSEPCLDCCGNLRHHTLHCTVTFQKASLLVRFRLLTSEAEARICRACSEENWAAALIREGPRLNPYGEAYPLVKSSRRIQHQLYI